MRERSPTIVSRRRERGPMRQPRPMRVWPSRMVPGRSSVSSPMLTPASMKVDAGSRRVTPASMCRSRMRARSSASAAASSSRELTPMPSRGSSRQKAATTLPSAAASAGRSVRYTSPDAFRCRRGAARRSQDRSTTYAPRFRSALVRCSSGSGLVSTMRVTVPSVARSTIPYADGGGTRADSRVSTAPRSRCSCFIWRSVSARSSGVSP